MTGEVLMHGFVDATVESEVVLIGLETCETTKHTFGAGLLIDPGGDGKVEHWLHFAGSNLKESVPLPRGIEMYGRNLSHGFRWRHKLKRGRGD